MPRSGFVLWVLAPNTAVAEVDQNTSFEDLEADGGSAQEPPFLGGTGRTDGRAGICGVTLVGEQFVDALIEHSEQRTKAFDIVRPSRC
ncbi:hypothetical protein ACVWYO_004232 [Sphingomonas sp. UYP23]